MTSAKMAIFVSSSTILSVISLLSIYSGEISSASAVKQKAWCVAKPTATNGMLQRSIDYSCQFTDCKPIKDGGACFIPNTLIHHTSFAMNAYYQRMGRHKWNCDFQGSALVAITDPSCNACTYKGGYSEDVDVGRTWCVAKPMISDALLQSHIDQICSQLDCSPIKPYGACFNPNTLIHHASFAMNLLYQRSLRRASACDFNKSAIIVATDPSYNGCIYT